VEGGEAVRIRYRQRENVDIQVSIESGAFLKEMAKSYVRLEYGNLPAFGPDGSGEGE